MDLVLSNDPNFVYDVHIKPGISDHERVLFSIPGTTRNSNPVKLKVFCYNKADMDLLRSTFASTSWQHLGNATCIESVWSNWKQLFYETVGKSDIWCTPKNYFRPNSIFLYINNMVTNLKSCCRLYADDCILYGKIKDYSDFIILQEDLNKLALW